jgi:hypothetical protein
MYTQDKYNQSAIVNQFAFLQHGATSSFAAIMFIPNHTKPTTTHNAYLV